MVYLTDSRAGSFFGFVFYLKLHDLQLHGLELFYFNLSSSLWRIDT